MGKFFLLADDDNDDAELFEEALSTINPQINFHRVEDGKDLFRFLDITQDKKPDVIFLDLNMPEMNGWQCLAKLKDDDSLRNIPVIIYSTSSLHKDKQTALEWGAIGFLTKPSDYKSLQNILKDISASETEELVKKFKIGSATH